MKFHTQTLSLLTASIIVALSGVFKLHIAFLFLGIIPKIPVYLAGFLVIYATYTLDRALGCEEDKINRKELASANQEIAIACCVISFVIGSILLYQEGLLLLAFLPFAIGYVYSKGICIGNRTIRLKGNFGMKNVTVSLTWGTFISGIVQRYADYGTVLFFIFPFFTIKSFINTVVYDFRDVEGDGAAGIKTLPICLGEKRTRKLLQVMHVFLHLWIILAMLLEFINMEKTIIFTVMLSGMVYTYFYTKPSPEDEHRSRKIMRDVLVDGEFILALSLRTITGF